MHLLRPILATAAAVLVVPQAAQAGTLDPLGPCYRSVNELTTETVPVRGRGFTPGEEVLVYVDGRLVKEGAFADVNGDVVGDVRAPFRAKGQAPFTVTLTERNQRSNTASATSRVAALGLRLKPSLASPSRRVRFTGEGFTDGPEVFAHYLRAGKLRKTVSLGFQKGPCGRINVKRRQIPIKRPAVGRWTLQVDNQPTYSAEPMPVYFRLGIRVSRVPRPAD